MNVSGNNGQVHFDGRVIRITREGLGGASSHLEPWSIPVTGVTDVVVHEPHGLIPGFICFVTRGHSAPTGYLSAATDAQSVVFKKKHLEEMVALQSAVQTAGPTSH